MRKCRWRDNGGRTFLSASWRVGKSALLLWLALGCGTSQAADKPAVWARVQLLEPRDAPYKVQVVVRPSYGTNINFFVGQRISEPVGGQYYPPSADELAAREKGVIAKFALDSVVPPASTSVSQIMAWPLWSLNGGAVLIANFTGNPVENVTIRFWSPQPVKSLRSIRQRELKFSQDKDKYVSCALAVKDVTDILIVNPK